MICELKFPKSFDRGKKAIFLWTFFSWFFLLILLSALVCPKRSYHAQRDRWNKVGYLFTCLFNFLFKLSHGCLSLSLKCGDPTLNGGGRDQLFAHRSVFVIIPIPTKPISVRDLPIFPLRSSIINSRLPSKIMVPKNWKNFEENLIDEIQNCWQNHKWWQNITIWWRLFWWHEGLSWWHGKIYYGNILWKLVKIADMIKYLTGSSSDWVVM